MKFPNLCLLALLAPWGLAAPSPKWGAIPEEDLKMTVFPLDSQASAVVLSEVGELSFSVGESAIKTKLEVHVRIKILTKAGVEQGNVLIPYYAKDGTEKISRFDLQVFSPRGEKTKVPDGEVFDEKVDDDYKRLRFAVPGLREGSVFEYRYELHSTNFAYPDAWDFQRHIPVRRSEFIVKTPRIFQYSYLLNGASRVKTVERRPHDEYVGLHIATEVTDVSYIADSLPALASEPYLTTLKNHRVSMQLQLDRILWPDGSVQVFMPTWPKMAEELWEHASFGLQIKKEKKHEKAWAALAPELAGATEPLEKLQAIYRILNEKMKWNEDFGILATDDLNDAFVRGSGSGADLNLTLVACLRRAGFEANPMILSTRSHGYASKLYPIIRQFNHVIAHVMVDTVPFLMDLANRNRPFNLIRTEALNESGFLVREKGAFWLDIPAPFDIENALVTLAIADDGKLRGSMAKTQNGYAAAGLRSDMADDPALKFVAAELAESWPDIALDSLQIQPHATQKDALVERYDFSIPGNGAANDMIYLNPPLMRIFPENPFKSEKRQFPVEFPFPRKYNFTLNLAVPAGYTVIEVPEAVNLALPRDGGRFRMVVGKTETSVQVSLRVSLNQLFFAPSEYESLRHFYDLVIEKQAEQIVLKKI